MVGPQEGIRMPRDLVFLLCFVALLPASASAVSIVESGHTGIWRSPARSGEGITVEILDANRASMAWFTYDESGGQRWAFSVGEIVRDADGAYIEFRDVSTVDGGVFGTAYDPATVQVARVGSATLRFEDCDRAVFSFDAYGQRLSLDYERLTRTMAAGCAPIHGIPGEPIKSYAGQSGVWSDPQRRGQGFQLQWMPNGMAGVGWYTFDHAGNQYWLTGVGHFDDGKIVFPNLISTRGARFGAAFDSADVEVIQWGRLELEVDCESGMARYESNVFGIGEQPVYLLTKAVPVGCPYATPKLTDIYDIEVTELPVEPTEPPPATALDGSSNVLFSQEVADDGTVVGLRKRVTGLQRRTRFWPIVWRPGRTAWADHPADLHVSRSIFVSGDGERLLASVYRGQTSDYVIHEPVIFGAEAADSIAGQLFGTTSKVLGASTAFDFVVGDSLRPSPEGLISVPWIWEVGRGQRELPASDEVPGASALFVGDGGGTVVGSQLAWGDLPGYGPGVINLASFSVSWESDAPPRALRDPAGRYLGSPIGCDARCDVVFGARSWSHLDDTHVLRGASEGAWFRKRSGEVGYLDSNPPPSLGSEVWTYSLGDVSGDGGLVVGLYRTPLMDGAMPNGTRGYGALLWSQNTGFVPLDALIEELGQLSGWPAKYVASISPNGEWLLLTTGEIYERPGVGSPTIQRSAVLRLQKKTVTGR